MMKDKLESYFKNIEFRYILAIMYCVLWQISPLVFRGYLANLIEIETTPRSERTGVQNWDVNLAIQSLRTSPFSTTFRMHEMSL